MVLGISGDGDTASIGIGQYCHMIRRNVDVTYIVENNGCYGLTKGQFSATADVGSKQKGGKVNEYATIDVCGLAIELGATFVARSFSGDGKQLVPLLQAALAHRGTAILDVISPCVTFNDHEGSTKSYAYVKDHGVVLHTPDFIAGGRDIAIDYEPGSAFDVELDDGSHVLLRKLEIDYDPTDRIGAMKKLHEQAATGEFVTGLLYVDTQSEDSARAKSCRIRRSRTTAKKPCESRATIGRRSCTSRRSDDEGSAGRLVRVIGMLIRGASTRRRRPRTGVECRLRCRVSTDVRNAKRSLRRGLKLTFNHGIISGTYTSTSARPDPYYGRIIQVTGGVKGSGHQSAHRQYLAAERNHRERRNDPGHGQLEREAVQFPGQAAATVRGQTFSALIAGVPAPITRLTWIAFALLSATFFVLLVDFSVVTIALPSMETSLNLSPSQGQWIVSTYAIFLAGFLMLTGRCADLYGRHKFSLLGLTLFTLGSLAGGLAQNGATLIAMRAVQGLGAALVNPAALAIVLQLFPTGAARSRAIALWGTIGSSGIAAGVLFGGILVQYLGWRSVMFFNVPVAIAILRVRSAFRSARQTEPGSREARRRRSDAADALARHARVHDRAHPDRRVRSQWTLIRLMITAVLFGAFLFVERRAAEPILPPRLFRYRGPGFGRVRRLAAADVVRRHLSLYVGLPAARLRVFAARRRIRVLAVDIVTSFIAAPLTIPIVRKLGVKPMSIVMAIIMIGGESILLTLAPHSSYWLVMFPATCIAAFGGMLSYQTGMIAGLAHVDDADEGSASAALSFALQIGIGFGVAFGAAAQELVAGRDGARGQRADRGAGRRTARDVLGIDRVRRRDAGCRGLGLRHAAGAEAPIRPHLPFGKLVHRAATKA